MSGHITAARALTPTVRIELSHALPPPPDAAVERRWTELAAANPRLFDGPILAVESIDLARGLARCRRDGFKRLAVRPHVPTGATLLSITGALSAPDASGVDHILLGRRSPQTRIYGGMWELAPSGGVEPPGDGAPSIGWHQLLRQLADELRTETGLSEPLLDPRFIAAVRDDDAFSTDLTIRARLPRPAPLGGNWEYAQTMWLPLPDLPAFAAREPFIGAARAVLPLLGRP